MSHSSDTYYDLDVQRVTNLLQNPEQLRWLGNTMLAALAYCSVRSIAAAPDCRKALSLIMGPEVAEQMIADLQAHKPIRH